MRNIETLFLGTNALKPTAGNDTASLLINGKCLVDTGWYSVINMLNYGHTIFDVDCLFITHAHLDHWIGLAQILFFLSTDREKYLSRAPLKIFGPCEDLEMIFNLAMKYIKAKENDSYWDGIHYDLIPLKPGEVIETEELKVETFRTVHQVASLGYKFYTFDGSKKVVYPGDTAPYEELKHHCQDADLLIHEASAGAGTSQGRGHSGAPDAASLAKYAGVKQLALLHYSDNVRQEVAMSAKVIFDNTVLPSPGDKITV